MSSTVAAAEANRDFSKLLRQVRDGRTFVITSHGRPVAKIAPVDARAEAAGGARAALFTRLRAQPAKRIGRWTRDELYDNEE